MKTLIAATKNKGKLKELELILGDIYNIISMEEAGLSLDIEETGSTFEENAVLKAKMVFKLSGLAAIADDSGLMVDALGGRPGVFSARYAFLNGENVLENDSSLISQNLLDMNFKGEVALSREDIDKANNKKLLLEMSGKNNRQAKFVSAIALVESNEPIENKCCLNSEYRCFVGYGEVLGEILLDGKGDNGFGYDPLFYSFQLKKTFGEASIYEKNEISHRKLALKDLLNKLK